MDVDGRARTALAEFTAVRLGFTEPAGWEVVVSWPPGGPARAELRRQGQAGGTPVEVGLDKILEMAIPFDTLGVAERQPVQFYVELLEELQSRDRAPREGTIHLTRPGADFEQRMWNA